MSSPTSDFGGAESISTPRNWRGRPGQQAEVRHRWQRDWTTRPATGAVAQRRVWFLTTSVCLLASAAMLLLFLYLVLFRAPQTPVLVISSPPYAWPLEPNAWSAEDLDRLRDLDGKSLQLLGADESWRTSGEILRNLKRQLAAWAPTGLPGGTVIIYISMHGAVNGAGEPCLIPPGASPQRDDSWLKIAELLAQIQESRLPDTVHKLVVLDCNRMLVNWHIGLLCNTFAEQLPAVVQRAGIPNLAVLSSAGPAQVGWTSAELRGSVFGEFLQHGLVGAADGFRTGQRPAVRDGLVSLVELHHYLVDQVGRWAIQHRAARQEPLLIPSDADFHVAWALRGRLSPRPREAHAVSNPEISELWQERAQLLSLEPRRVDPLLWREIEHQLLYLEQARRSGTAYASSAAEARDKLQEKFRQIASRRQRRTATGSSYVARSILAGDELPARDELRFHSLPLCTFFAQLDDEGSRPLTGALNRFQQVPNAENLAAALVQFDRVQQTGRLPEFTESHFLRLLTRYRIIANASDAPQRPATLGEAAGALAAGEQVAVPDDLRCLPWLQAHVVAGDSLRRQAEDALFSRQDETASELFSKAKGHYALASETNGTLSAAWALGDQVWAELPYLAQWLARPCENGTSSHGLDQTIDQTLLPLIENAHRFDRLLHAGTATEPTDTAEMSRISAPHAELAARFESLRVPFLEECNRLEREPTATVEAVYDLRAVLATPLVPATQRQILSEKLVAFEAAVDANAAPEAERLPLDETATGVNGTAASTGADFLARIEGKWRQHPALAILRRDEIAATPDKIAVSRPGDPLFRCVADGRAVRDLLRGVPERVSEFGRDTGGARPTQAMVAEGTSLTAGWGWLQAEQLVRCAAPLWFPAPEIDPTARRQRLDAQRMLLWHCQRVLEDFRGPAAVGQEPFFQHATLGYLHDVDLLGELTPDLATRVDQAKALLDWRRQALRDGLRLTAENVLVLDQTEMSRSAVVVSPATEVAREHLPHGQAALLLRGSNGELETVRYVPRSPGQSEGSVSLPITENQASFELVGDRLLEQGPVLHSIAMLRGNEYATRLVVNTLGGTRLQYQPYTSDVTQVTLLGQRKQRSSIVFILDASASMSEPTTVESAPAPVSRMEVAKNALQGMLDLLVQDGESRVGVFFFGHRVGWTIGGETVVRAQPDYSRPIPDDLSPSEDAENVLPLGRFDSVAAGQVAELMKSVKPWGQSPLYRTLTESLHEFAKEEPGTQKTIIALTDGANYQFMPAANSRLAAKPPTTVQDVLTAFRNQNVRVHIVGFGIPSAEMAQAESEYSTIAKETGGSYQTAAAKAAELLKRLEELLPRSSYYLENRDGTKVGVASDRNPSSDSQSSEARLGTPLAILPPPPQPAVFTVVYDRLRQDLKLEAGQRAELVISDDGRRFESVADLAGSPRFGRLIVGGSGTASGFAVGVHRPTVESGGVRLTVSVQHENRLFAPRPAEFWVEVTPLMPDRRSASPVSCYYDTNYDPTRPVPVVSWLATPWPAGAGQASVRCWCKSEPTPADHSMTLRDLASAPLQDLEIAGVPGLRIDAAAREMDGGFSVRVVERHGADSPSVYTVKVALAGPSDAECRPIRVERRFDSEHRVATHVFTFSQVTSQLLDRCKLQITRREKLEFHAQQLIEPVVVDVARDTDLIPPLSMLPTEQR